MAGIIVHANSGEVSLTANTPKTVLQLKAPSNQRLVLTSLRLLGKQPAGGTDVPVKVRLTRSTANFGTGTPTTPAKNDPTDSEAVQSTAAANFSAEPTSPTDGGLWWEFSPQSGVIEPFAPGQEVRIPGGQALNVECTAPGAATVLVTATYQE